MNDGGINSKLASVIILLHECGYDGDYMVCSDNYRITAAGKQVSYFPAEAGLSLVSAFYLDRSGLFTVIFTVSTPYGDKGICLPVITRQTRGRVKKSNCRSLLVSRRNDRQLKDKDMDKYKLIRQSGPVMLCLAVAFACSQALAQQPGKRYDRVAGITDSTQVSAHAGYNDVSGIHRWLFGENYRREWAVNTKLPVLHIGQLNGGMTPIRQGGGMQSKSLRLKAANGEEWVLRSVEKIPDKLLPEGLMNTFVIDWVGDEFSAQHPYSALVVPPLAEAAGVPHAHPVIGVVGDDPELGEYRKTFAGLVCLLEEREPTGHSVATIKMEERLVKSYNNRLDGEGFLRARMLDLLIGDWDRHEDQWRFTDSTNNGINTWTGVPRDRDQVFHLAEGLFPSIASVSWLDPTLEHYEGDIPRVKWSLFKTRFLKAFPDQQLTYDRWMQLANEFVKAETDQVLEESLRRLPKATYDIRHDVLFAKLKARRDHIPAAVSEYYKFINRIADLRLTAKAENITIADAADRGLDITVRKVDKKGITGDTLWKVHYYPDITKELRLYTSGGADQVHINTPASPIRLRLVDSTGENTIDVAAAAHWVNVYGPRQRSVFTGDQSRIRPHFSVDTMNNRFQSTNLYSIWMPLATAAVNADDGFLLGLGFKYTGVDGFRKLPYSTRQSLMVTHAFASDAFRVHYTGEWIDEIGKADLVLEVDLQGPANRINFFGLGNETSLDKSGNYHRFYRARYDIYNFSPSLRWQTGKQSDFSAGPAIQHYRYNDGDNIDRFIGSNQARRFAFDSLTIGNTKMHVGLAVNFTSNRRDNPILPKSGYFFTADLVGFKGINDVANNYSQLKGEFTAYKKLNSRGTFVISDRVGGGVTIGKPEFYQSLYLGGQGNLLGYLKYRFAGQQMVFNNFQARLKLIDVASYILPGQLGISGFYDTGRVWVKGEHSDKWHQGVGGGMYFAPAGLTVVQLLTGHSEEGWYPYISMNFRL